jgi:hypothetical protein
MSLLTSTQTTATNSDFLLKAMRTLVYTDRRTQIKCYTNQPLDVVLPLVALVWQGMCCCGVLCAAVPHTTTF